MTVDYLLVGQGIAGTMLSWFLRKANKTFIVIDNEKTNSASRVAAGIINPVTGKRLVESWMVRELIPFADECYREMEQFLKDDFWSSQTIHKYFSNQEDVFFHREKRDLDTLSDFVSNEKVPEYPGLKNTLGGITIQQVFRLDLARLIASWQAFLSEEQRLVKRSFSYDQLNVLKQGVQYGQLNAKQIIFCEGSQVLNNPYFNWLPFRPAKGDVLTVRIPELNSEAILQKGVFILPLGDDLYRVGATYQWNFDDDLPTEDGRDELIQKLSKALECDFEVVEHQAAVRPTVVDRRPILGIHPAHPQIVILNGLGTKGASLAPYFADHLVNCLNGKSTLDKEVDLNRFHKDFPQG